MKAEAEFKRKIFN